MAYLIRMAGVTPELTGQWDGPAWREVEPIDVAVFQARSSDHRPKTQVKLLYDARRVYVHFRV